MEVASSSSSSPHSIRLCHVRNSGFRDSRNFSSSSPPPPTPPLVPFCVYKAGVHSGHSLYRRSILRSSSNFSSKCFFHHSKKQIPALQHHPSRKVKFNRPYYYDNLYSQNRYYKYTVRRCELAEFGNSGAALPLAAHEVLAKVRGVCFYAVTAIAAIILFQLMLVAHPFVFLLDRYQRKAQHFIAKIWSTLTVAPFVRIEVQGLENLPPPDTPAVYVSNHQSFLDIYTLLTLGRSFKFISKTSIFLYPIIGWAMYLLGTIPLKRMDSRSQLECFKRCMDLIKKGASVFFFPEGTRSRDGKLGDFKKGAFSVAAKTRVPVVPMTLIGTGKIMPAGHEGIVNSGSVKVVIHKPIEGSDAETLCNEAKSTIAKVLNCQG
ncbi:1-acyl-sn-glycerol-3-phosphate acyltransferase BAT2, chloroplastic [Syzygium oleosum]|uniref:1-acyl-sn-glycerol-3-phosphate acyltransferase BAT2, chloroplastic n=1 Tax=Syzygium oleosum TaxID=219896 RepID=UPI0011D1E77D|nr:1-acyl-sn-glycerol-3-phosphate acyltransferase BAT2, chloroplastic [Syzygium oleosum]XP_030459009.1 1-acyl-sn-glycerol-3-phosphate acyltransferase BAT2, chloroplastic [Syzygium oleosum]